MPSSSRAVARREAAWGLSYVSVRQASLVQPVPTRDADKVSLRAAEDRVSVMVRLVCASVTWVTVERTVK